jgi:DNA-binding response OmpR family regulator/class 3 adenylate cyclase
LSGGRTKDVRKTVLVVAQDAVFRANVARALITAGYMVELAESERRTSEVVERADIAVFSPDTFGSAGQDLARKLGRTTNNLILASDRPDLVDEFRPLITHCIVTSLNAQEILEQVKEVLETAETDTGAPGDPRSEMLTFGGLTLDVAGHALLDAQGQDVPLTSTEFTLLLTLSRNPGRVLSRDHLRASVAGRGADAFDRSIDVMVSRLRRKIEADPKTPILILTVPGVGYKFAGKPRIGGNEPTREAAPTAASADALSVADRTAREPTEERPAERRQLTVMACEFVGLSPLSKDLDPEDFSAVTQTHQKRCTDIIESWHGRVANLSTDGILAYFGEPHADEHDAERALRAGLELINPAATARDVTMPLRIGIASGIVVIGQPMTGGIGSGFSAVGEAPYLAQRMKAAADPDTLVIAQGTRDLVRGLFECRDLGSTPLEGYPGGIQASQVVRATAAENRFEARHEINDSESGRKGAQRGLTPFVGRNAELEMLLELQARAGSGLCVVDIAGDPGIGKSRLQHEFRERLIEMNVFVLSGSCWPDSQQTAFRPFIEVVRRSFRITDGDRDVEITRKLEQGLAYLGIATSENVGLLLNLLGLKAEALAGLEGVLIGLRTRDLLLALLHERSRPSRVAVLLEDLHWIDRASQELISRLIDSENALPLLVVNTFRPEYRAPWADRSGVVSMVLAPLPASDTARIAEARLESREHEASLVRLITERAEGNPLFAEEIANFVVEQAWQPSGALLQADAASLPIKLPASLQSLLTARVHRLAQAERLLLRAASVIGRRFSADLLAAVTSASVDLVARLIAMEETDLIRRDGETDIFVFKHALVRDALYESLLGPARADLHLKVASETERRFAAHPIEAAEILAPHYARTSRTDKAIEFLAMAGRKSSGVYSLDEAEKFLRQAFALAQADEANAYDPRSMNILADLTKVLTHGFKTRDIIALVEPRIASIMALDDNVQVPVILYFYGFALFVVCRFAEGRRIQERSITLANRHGDPRAKAYAAAGLIFLSGTTEPLSDDEFQRIVDAAYADAIQANDVHTIGTTLRSIAWGHINQGRACEGAEWADRLLAFGRERRDPRSIAVSLWVLGWSYLVREDYAAALSHAEECVAIAVTPMERMNGSLIVAFAKIFTGKTVEGAKLMQQVRDEAVANHWHYMLTGIDGSLGVAMVLNGEIAKGLSHLIELVSTFGNVAGADLGRMMLAEIYTTLLLGQHRPPFRVLVKNLAAIVNARLKASRETERLLNVALKNPHFSEQGIFRARIELQFGRLYRARKQPASSRTHLERAHAIASAQNAPKMLERIVAEMAYL